MGHDVRVGIGRSVALDNLAERADVAELKTFVAALAQADRLGSPVSQTLEIQSQEIRVKRRQFAEEQAMKLPVKLLFPMVFCILPVLTRCFSPPPESRSSTHSADQRSPVRFSVMGSAETETG